MPKHPPIPEIARTQITALMKVAMLKHGCDGWLIDSVYAAATEFVGSLLEFTRQACFPPSKAAVILNIAAQVLLTRCQSHSPTYAAATRAVNRIISGMH